MKKLGDLMKELGFNPNASAGAQEAFLKHLVRQAYGQEIAIQARPKRNSDSCSLQSPEQLSFDIQDLIAVDQVGTIKKRSGQRRR